MKTYPLATLWLAVAAPACDVFDPALYREAEHEGSDAGADGGGAGTPTVGLADRCTDEVPLVEPSPQPRLISTAALGDHFRDDIAACTGVPEPGNDGFFRVELVAGQRLHFHLHGQQTNTNPALYVLRSCDERACSANTSLDECGTGRDEHISFVAPAAGTYFVGVDSSASGGADYELVAVRPVCGNGGQPEHSETCDDGDVENGDGCDSDCRAELSSHAPVEVEPNDEPINANVVLTGEDEEGLTATGRLGGRCDFDTFALDVPAGGSLQAAALDANGHACGDDAAELRMVLLRPDGFTAVGQAEASGDDACPSIGEDASFATDLAAGRYFVRITTVRDEPDPFDYRLRLRVSGRPPVE